MGGSKLWVTIDGAKNIPSACASQKALFANRAQALASDLPDECYAAVMKIPAPIGVSVSASDFGNFLGMYPDYRFPIPFNFARWGYVVGTSLFGAPYDWRYTTAESLSTLGFTSSLEKLIESAYKQNMNRKVILVAHSNGAIIIYDFLKSMTNDWKDKYIACFISLSGNFLGQMNGYATFFYSGYGTAMKPSNDVSDTLTCVFFFTSLTHKTNKRNHKKIK